MGFIRWCGVFLLFMLSLSIMSVVKDIIKETIRYDTTGKNEILLNTAKNAPLPNKNIYGMNQIVNDENLYVEFFKDVKIDSNSNSILCDYLDKDLKNELKILVLHFNDSQVGKEETFSGMTISQMNEYLNQIKNLPKSDERFQNVEFIDGGCLKVNGNVVIYAVHKDSSQPVKTIFQYHVAKNRKIYVLFYSTVDSINNKPNDVILTSLNTLRMK